MDLVSSPSMDSCEDSTFADSSTAPTTPEGSYMSSPLLRPQVTEALGMSTMQTRPIRNICCVGAGYVGGPTAAVMAFNNPSVHVAVVDLNSNRIRRWNSRHPPIYEPGLEYIVRIARDGTRETVLINKPGRGSAVDMDDLAEIASQRITVPTRRPNLVFSTEVDKCISEADIVLIAVNTPTKTRGAGKGCATDMAAFEAVTGEVARHAKPGAIVVEKSTVPCRTAQLVQRTMAIHRPGVHFEILSNPEFLAAGTAVKDLLYPDRILIGSSPTPGGREAASTLASVYAAWVPRERIITTNVWSSELAKLVANSMLAQRISSINSIAEVCEKTGADVDEVAAAIGADPRIGDKFLKAGIGFGGSCFKKDVLSLVYLAESLGLDEVAQYWRQVNMMNEYSRDRFTSRVVRCLNNTLAGKKVTILGYAFKKNTNDTRESPALAIIRKLLEEGPKEVAVFDPYCNPAMVREEIKRLLRSCEGVDALWVYENAYEACTEADAILITTDFDEFKNGWAKGKRSSNTSISAEGLNEPGHLHLFGQSHGPSRKPDSSPSFGIGRTSHTGTPGAAAKATNDPRPFAMSALSDLNLLVLHRHLLEKLPTATQFVGAAESSSDNNDPLERLLPEPACGGGCPGCQLEDTGYAPNSEYKPEERMDWAKISYHMKQPRWVFDGRGVLTLKDMELLGFQIESIGR